MNFLEINPNDAEAWGIVSGDLLSIESSDVIDQLGEKTKGALTAVAYVADTVPPGVTFTYFLFPGSPANAVTPGDTNLQPINLRYNFKLGKVSSPRSEPPTWSAGCPSSREIWSGKNKGVLQPAGHSSGGSDSFAASRRAT